MDRVADENYKNCRRINDPGDTHYLTFSCFRKRPFLTSDRNCEGFLAGLKESCVKHDYGLWAYVLMPEHVHLIVRPLQSDYEVSAFLFSVKRPVALSAIQYARSVTETVKM